jgi:phospholipid-binding lipoprotein MlaA
VIGGAGGPARKWVCGALLLIFAAFCAGCATSAAVRAGDVPDRFEKMNRRVYRFDRNLDIHVVRPVARFYDRVMPKPVEHRVRNFFANLYAPIDIINNFLQAKFKHGFSDIGRFLLNSTVGIAGIFDPARKLGLERHPEDFGQTLAVWGVPSGGPLMLPILGIGTVRDWGAWTIDIREDVLWYNDSDAKLGLVAWRFISDRAALLPGERALEASYDEYLFVRDAYLQHRRYLIYDGAPPPDDDYLHDSDDEERPDN